MRVVSQKVHKNKLITLRSILFQLYLISNQSVVAELDSNRVNKQTNHDGCRKLNMHKSSLQK